MTVIWHDVECGAYSADLALWDELAAAANGGVLELGCGTGRVALHLARRGHDVTGIDSDAQLVDELRRRAAAQGLPVTAVHGDARHFSLDTRFGLVIAPMQLIQVLPGPIARASCLSAIAAHLLADGIAALALVEAATGATPPSPPLPDVREVEGWIYSSLPLRVQRRTDGLLIERLRQTVSPGGTLQEEVDRVRMQILDAERLESEAGRSGLRAAGTRHVEATESHLGSTVVLLEAV